MNNTQKKQAVGVFAAVVFTIFICVIISLAIKKSTEAKIQAYDAKVQQNEQRIVQLDNVLKVYYQQMNKLLKDNNQISMQLDSISERNKILNQSINLQKLKVSKLKKDLFHERHKTTYSDSTINAILQGFSE
jgi:small-conductance mechanosensitive channel